MDHPENYQDASFRAKMLPYCRPNIHLTEGRDSLDFDHSGDADGNNKLDSNDPFVIRNGTYTFPLKADFLPNLIVNEEDAQSLDSVLTGQKENRYEHMNRSERIDLLRAVLATDSANYPPRDDIYWDCRNYFLAHKKVLSGVEDAENSLVADEELYGKNASKNIQIYAVDVVTSGGINHSLVGMLAGPESNERLAENPEKFSHWYLWNPSGLNELQEVKRGDANFASTSSVDIIDYGKMLNGSHSSTYLVGFDSEDTHLYSHPYLIPFNPASSQEEITIENVPEDILINYQPDIDLSPYIAQMPDTAYAKSNLPTSLEKTVSENIPLNAEYPNHHYKKVITYKASTGYKYEVAIREIIVKDIAPPTIEDLPQDRQLEYSTNLNLENYVILENLTATDNSELEVILEKSTHLTQVMDGTINQVRFTQIDSIKATDICGNDTTYLVKQEVDDTQPGIFDIENTNVEVKEADYTSVEDHIKVINKEDNSELPLEEIYDSYLIESNNLYDKYEVDVSVKDIAGNISEIKTAHLTINKPTGFGDNPSDLEKACGLTPYPNPNPHGIKFYQSDFGQTEISVSDMSGRKMRSNVYNSQPGENIIAYDFDLAQGIYVVTMDSKTCKDSYKFEIK